MAFTQKTWDTETPLLPEDANRWEQAMKDHDTAIGSGTLSTINKDLIGAVNELKSASDETNALIAAQKNMIFVDKQIGTAITEEQSAAIKAGTFTGLNVGNYWLSGGIKYRIAGFDIFYKCGDNVSLGHHVVVVPDTCIKNGNGSTTHWMQDTDTTDGGYVGSKMCKDTLPNTILPIIEGIFGSHILQHREILSNATSGGLASGWAWYDRKVDLMCEHMLYGASVWGNGKYNVGIGARQLPLFRMAHNLIHADRNNFWLRDVVSSTNFAYCNNYGSASSYGASYTGVGVRPYFLLQ